VTFVDGPIDQLDHGANQALFGGKMAIDGTRKWPEEGYKRVWPEVCRQSAATEAKVDARWLELGLDPRWMHARRGPMEGPATRAGAPGLAESIAKAARTLLGGRA